MKASIQDFTNQSQDLNILDLTSTGLRFVSDGRRQDRWSAKYELLHTVRTHMGASDANFGCVVQREDANGKVRQHSTGTVLCLSHSQLPQDRGDCKTRTHLPAQATCGVSLLLLPAVLA